MADLTAIDQFKSHRKYWETNLVHLEQSLLSHLFQRTNLSGLLFARQVHLAISTLPNLSDDVELINLQLCSSPPQKDSLAPAVRLELLGIFRRGEAPRGGVRVEISPPLFTRADISQELEIVVQEIWCRCG